ncbi:unnamed protein product [Rotaria socialis]|uniref:Signal peptidase complex catalytic subunit SEC11 n=1 Tax=Rotaria socialis TaxID=392032 RepID=A0A820LUE2_9BILA|nr:unnamed protein product [Rotaria socialis]CAF3561481.1 unnamed protein product [Rotaria socialis]CAF4362550.1 unnamed protein product [Rotaria socialis]CAF4832254.1 unnamed protein product [Rotaria socialis]
MDQRREIINLVLKCALICSTIIIVWKTLILLTNCASPMIISLNGEQPDFRGLGDILVLTNYDSASVQACDLVVFRIEGRDIPIVHRVIKVRAKKDGYFKILTKGYMNVVDDRGLYPSGQLWIEKKDVIGKVYGYVQSAIFRFSYC